MKILHLIYDHIYNPWVGGGGAVRVYEIYKKLGNSHDITIVSGRFPGASGYIEGNIRFLFLGTDKGYVRSTFSFAWQANRYIGRHWAEYDVIVEDFAPWNPVFSCLVKNKPVVLQIQNYMGKEILKKYNLAGLPFYLVERFYPRFFENCVVLLDNLNRRFHIDGAVIPQGIHDEHLEEDSADGHYAAFLGRIDIRQKGLDILSDAMRTAPVKLKIAGDGRDRTRLLRMLEDNPSVEWVGTVTGDRKRLFLRESSFLVVPSRFEGQGIVVLEAAAFGKPAVVSDIPELRYAVDAGFALCFKTGDSGDLAEKMRRLLNDETLRNEMGLKAREYARNFTWDTISAEYACYLMQVVEARQG
ncbi:MAG: glycosyltransferase family 4 protein [Nitrospiraceae bacterium]|nr:glycosyltransferase family 4 protein [Nitrospiraceae bacterium]